MTIIKYSSYFIALLIMTVILAGCEDVIDVEIERTDAVVVIDAWLNDLDETQRIEISRSQTYFASTGPIRIIDAEVVLRRDDGEIFEFEHQGKGIYEWNVPGQVIGAVGNNFILEVQERGVTYISNATIKRVPVIDSIGVEFRDDELFSDDGLYANFFSRDFQGTGDAYWIKTFANGAYLDKATELNIAYDAGFDSGTGVDGIVFITPIRERINRLDSDGLTFPYEVDDEIRVELHSMSIEAFNFMEIVRDQINNSQNGIFALPLANARTNISSDDGSAVLGFFNVAAVSVAQKVVE